ncbi:sulfite oxidase [Saccharopolyspora sp. K220]|uniref:sulfite oxidase n=1 Tax=Saccharopolyspora soli TaxID=2926618 RepID=UPI001F59C9B1|nr:sulfite oxidase [Saccharopolyspora soli]MCI2421559.1 sulfite oxidase [Saccharopolyspora soli]
MTGSMSAPTTTAPTFETDRKVVKPTPAELMEDTGTGLDYGTRPDRMPGHLTPNDRFFIRSHAPTPRLDAATWTLHVEGNGVREPIAYTYDDLWSRFPLASVVRTIECAGNRRVLFGEEIGRRFTGTQWGRGAISTAEWTGVRLRDLLEPAGITPGAREVMPEGLDEIRARRPMPLAKAWADDTVVALAMNGEVLPADHGFPARLVVSGWLGAASIKWLGRIEVSEDALYVPWNTEDYVLIGPDFPADEPALGPAINALTVTSLVELPWPARLRPEPQTVRGRAFAGENRVARVEYRIDDGRWQDALITSPATPGVWVRWQFCWNPEPGEHTLRVRATDDQGNTQPESSSWNELGYLHHSVLTHPVRVEQAAPRGGREGNACGRIRRGRGM